MDYFIYLFLLIGSISTGYLLLRTGFPKSQEYKLVKKIIFSYLLGVLTLLIALGAIIFFGLKEIFFPILYIIISATLLVMLFAKRVILKEKDPLLNINTKNEKTKIPQIINQKTTPKSANIKTSSEIIFEKGLMVKTLGNTKKQVFKEKESNIDKETKEEKPKEKIEKKELQEEKVKENVNAEENIKDKGNKKENNEKNEALEMLRKSAQEIKETKKQKKENKLSDKLKLEESEDNEEEDYL